ncbi:uncharacterized protein LOC125470294 [Pyrus x bretschneideri]|uniref:uncharacterized protein LOC125470294 n=1 Tax=Pyrus x bretschneideri TaxID=225117 RepID=UPI0020305103|nr:uncharacterized protein LOC125470294 [Pyrus x bretschneideri]
MRGVKLFFILASNGECLIELIGSCRNKVQVYRSVRMPQLHTSLHFHLTPIVMINGSSHRDLLLNSQNFCRSTLAEAEDPSLSWLCYQRLWGSRNRRALILGWAYYLDAFSSYPLRTWLPSVYRGHDNWYTRGASFPVLSSRTALMGEQPNPWNILQPQVAKSRHRGAKPSRRCDNDPSTRHCRITKANFRPCSTVGSCSQAPICLCTRRPISVWPKETFARLLYLLGGLRPIEKYV